MIKIVKNTKIENISEVLKNISENVLDIEQRGKDYFEGINIEDYQNLRIIQSILERAMGELLDDNQNISEDIWYLYNKVNCLINFIYHTGFFQKYGRPVVDYILKNTNILPLVLANDLNNSVKDNEDFNYYFDCQFDNSKGHLMAVNNITNTIYCGECKELIDNSIIYLQKIEKISYREAVSLLAQIYLIDPKSFNKVDNELVKKYRKALLSEKYMNLLRNTKYKIESDNYDDIRGINVEQY